MAETKPQSGKQQRPKHRSPNYPLVSLKKAVEQVRALYDKDKQQAVPIQIAHDRWGYKRDGSAGNQCVAALKAYTLLDVLGQGNKRKVNVSERARRILLGHQDKAELLRSAALGPSIHQEVWKHFHGELPQDDVLRQYLLFERHFNEDSVDAFIARFRETVDFASLQADNGNGGESTDDQVSDGDLLEAEPKRFKLPVPMKGMREIKVPLVSGDAVMYLPNPMREIDYKLLGTHLEAAQEADKARQQQPASSKSDQAA